MSDMRQERIERATQIVHDTLDPALGERANRYAVRDALIAEFLPGADLRSARVLWSFSEGPDYVVVRDRDGIEQALSKWSEDFLVLLETIARLYETGDIQEPSVPMMPAPDTRTLPPDIKAKLGRSVLRGQSVGREQTGDSE